MFCGEVRGKAFEDAELGGECAAVVHVDLVFAGPVEGLAFEDLEAFEIDFVFFVEVQVFAWEVAADNANHFDGSKKAGGNSGVAGAAAEQAGIFRVRRFD